MSLAEKFDRDNAFWVFNSLDNLVDSNYGHSGKGKEAETRAIEYVSGRWKEFEDNEFALQDAVEKVALELYEKDRSLACSFLGTYSNALSLWAFIGAQELADTLRTKYYK